MCRVPASSHAPAHARAYMYRHLTHSTHYLLFFFNFKEVEKSLILKKCHKFQSLPNPYGNFFCSIENILKTRWKLKGGALPQWGGGGYMFFIYAH